MAVVKGESVIPDERLSLIQKDTKGSKPEKATVDQEHQHTDKNPENKQVIGKNKNQDKANLMQVIADINPSQENHFRSKTSDATSKHSATHTGLGGYPKETHYRGLYKMDNRIQILAESYQFLDLNENHKFQEKGAPTRDDKESQIQIQVIADINPFLDKILTNSASTPGTTVDTIPSRCAKCKENHSDHIKIPTKIQRQYRGLYKMDNTIETLSSEKIKVQSPKIESSDKRRNIGSFTRFLMRGLRALLCCCRQTNSEED